MGHDRLQRRAQALPLLPGERREQRRLGAFGGLVGLLDGGAPRIGELDDVAPPVFAVRMARDQALLLERVEPRHHRRPVDTEPLRRLVLGAGLVTGDHKQNPELARVNVERCQCLRGELIHPQLCVLEQVSQAPAYHRPGSAVG